VNELEPPKPGAADRILDLGLAVVGDLPIIGGTTAELLRQTFGTPLERRRDASLAMLASAVEDLRARQVDPVELANRPEWVSAALQATSIAFGEHLESKIEMLRAVIINAGLHETDRDADMLTMRYLRWVEEFEPEHMIVLRRLAAKPCDDYPDGFPDHSELVAAVSQLPSSFVALAAADLETARLIGGLEVQVERTPILPKANPGPLDPVAGGWTNRGQQVIAPVKGDLSNAFITGAGRRFLEWITVV
jgi:hypothetical protein